MKDKEFSDEVERLQEKNKQLEEAFQNLSEHQLDWSKAAFARIDGLKNERDELERGRDMYEKAARLWRGNWEKQWNNTVKILKESDEAGREEWELEQQNAELVEALKEIRVYCGGNNGFYAHYIAMLCDEALAKADTFGEEK